jgi:uncharacterized membrane protein
MESRVKLFGHPVHPMLIVVPLGLFISAVILDVLYFTTTANATLGLVGFWNIGIGIIGGLVAAVFGLIDWLAIPSGTRAKRIGLMHAGSNVLMLALFTLAWLDRFATADHLPTSGNLTFEVGALAIGMVAGWLGGELVDRLGVGVDEGANLNAPNSLSGRPAGSNVAKTV